MEKILASVKKHLGIEPDYTHFDEAIIMDINGVFMTLYQLGVGPSQPFKIEDAEAEWGEFLEDKAQLEMVKPYMYMKVRLMFDPPSSSFVADSFTKQIEEAEWRLNVSAETPTFGGIYELEDKDGG